MSRVVPGGRICAWVYGREGNGWIVCLVDPVRKRITSRLPRPALWVLSTVLTIPLHGLLRLAFQCLHPPVHPSGAAVGGG